MEENKSTQPMVECENLVKIYKTKDVEVLALQGLELRIDRGELMAIIGNSGSGKSTFLNMIGGLDRPSAGRLIVDGKDLFKLSDRQLVDYKRRTVGFVWQNNARNLVPYLTAWQNVQMPMLFERGADKKARAMELLEMVGLSHKKHSRLAQLSGGEQQRIAIARAMLKNAPILILDEATAFADPDNEAKVQAAFGALAKGKTVIMIAHRLTTVANADCIYVVQDGKIAEAGTKDALCAQGGLFAKMWRDYQSSVQWKVAKEGQV